MSQARPKLIVFDLSHFCEKARWALDWHGIAYDEISWAPGLHRVLLKRYGGKCQYFTCPFGRQDHSSRK